MREKRNSIKRNFIYNTGYQIFRILIPFITAPYLARVLGVNAIGIQSFTASIQSYFLLFASLGTMTYGAREISRARDDIKQRSKLFWEIEIITIATSILALLVWSIVIWHEEAYRLYYTILSIGIVAVLFDITWFFNGMELFKISVIRSTLIRIIGTVCIFVFVKTPSDLWLYILINALTSLISNLSLWFYMPRYLVKVNLRELRYINHIKETFIFFIPTIATSIYTMLDKTLIGLITKDSAQNGYYEQAERIISMAKSVVYQSLNAVVGVRIAYLYTENKTDEIQTRIENSINYIFFMGFGCCFGLMGISKTFIPFFFGDGYDGVIPLIYILCPIIIIIGISNCLDAQYYTPFGKQRLSARFIVLGAILNLVLNLILIPQIGSTGAAISSVTAELLITALFIRFSQGFGKLQMIIRNGYKKLVAGITMFLVVDILNKLAFSSIMRLSMQIFVGCIVYLSVLLIFKDTWTKNTTASMIKKVMQIFSRNKGRNYN